MKKSRTKNAILFALYLLVGIFVQANAYKNGDLGSFIFAPIWFFASTFWLVMWIEGG